MEDICMDHEKQQIIYNFFGNDLTDVQMKRLQKFISDLKHEYSFSESPVFEIDEKDAESFDRTFETMEKAYLPSQEEFYILSHSVIM